MFPLCTSTSAVGEGYHGAVFDTGFLICSYVYIQLTKFMLTGLDCAGLIMHAFHIRLLLVHNYCVMNFLILSLYRKNIRQN